MLFENQPFGHDAGREIGEEAFYVFDIDDMERYNNNVGIETSIYQEPGKGWKIIKCLSKK